MNARHPTLIDILRPRHFAGNAARAKVTRTILQPEVDEFEQKLAAGDGTSAAKRSARPTRRTTTTESALQRAA